MKAAERKELGTGRVAFLARKDEIKERIDSGRTSMSVYREYQKQVDISYSQFARYVSKYIKGNQKKAVEKQPAKDVSNAGEKVKPLINFDPVNKKDIY